MCVTINDLEYVRRTLSLLPNELQLDTMLETIEAVDNDNFEYREEITSLLDTTINDLEAEITVIVSRIGVKVRNSPTNFSLYRIVGMLMVGISFADAIAVEKIHVSSRMVSRLVTNQ